MPIETSCASCGRRLQIPDELIGQPVRCPDCCFEFSTNVDSTSPSAIQWTPDLAPPPLIRRDELSSPDTEGSSGSAGSHFQESEPRAAPPRPGRLENGHDEFDETPRRRNVLDRSYVSYRLRGPANGLLMVGIINLLLLALRIGLLVLLGEQAEDWSDEASVSIVVNAILTVGQAVCSILILYGARRMKRVESYGMAKAAAIIAMIPMVSPCCLLGIPLGWRALSALGRSDVILAFDQVRRNRLNLD
jgi:hypothetical protein